MPAGMPHQQHGCPFWGSWRYRCPWSWGHKSLQAVPAGTGQMKISGLARGRGASCPRAQPPAAATGRNGAGAAFGHCCQVQTSAQSGRPLGQDSPHRWQGACDCERLRAVNSRHPSGTLRERGWGPAAPRRVPPATSATAWALPGAQHCAQPSQSTAAVMSGTFWPPFPVYKVIL